MIAMFRNDSVLFRGPSGAQKRKEAPRRLASPGISAAILLYCVAIVAPKAWSTGPIGLANEPPEPPAKQSPTGLLPVSVTIREPESPERMNVAGVMIWPVKVETPAEYPTLIVTVIAWIRPWVSPD